MDMITTFVATALVIFALGQAIAAHAPNADVVVAPAHAMPAKGGE